MEHIELDPLITASTGVRRTTIAVLVDEVVDDFSELIGVIEGVEGDLQQIRYSTGIDGILDGATGAALLCRLTTISQSQEGTDHLMTLLLQ